MSTYGPTQLIQDRPMLLKKHSVSIYAIVPMVTYISVVITQNAIRSYRQFI